MKCFLTTLVLFFALTGARGQGDFALPAIPDTIRQVDRRASFLALNYWNGLDMRNESELDNGAVEQAFVDFLDVLTFCPAAQRAEAIDAHVDLMAKGTRSWRYYFCDLYEKYLVYSDSPMQNQELMIVFLESFVSNPKVDKLDKMRPEYQLEIALKNREGDLAADIKVRGVDDQKSSLLALSGSGSGYTMVMFYNPDCNSCAEQIALAIDSPEFSDAVDAKTLRVVAVYPGNDTQLWLDSMSKIPCQWINVMAQESVDQLYDLTSIPTIYLLDNKNSVVLKNTTIPTVINYLVGK